MPVGSNTGVTALVQGEQFNQIHDALEPLGIGVIRVERVKQAVEAAPRVVVCEADSSGSWRRIIRQILEARPEARVVLLSRVADERMWVEALSAGAHDLLSQPCSVQELCGTVLGALGLHHCSLAA